MVVLRQIQPYPSAITHKPCDHVNKLEGSTLLSSAAGNPEQTAMPPFNYAACPTCLSVPPS